MLQLRSRILAHLFHSPANSPVSHLRRLISAAVSSNPSSFAVEDYLVAACGLTRPQAVKASAKLSHLKSPANPDAVLAFLAGIGLSGADAAALVAKDPKLLCAGVERTLAPVVVGLAGLGLSRPDIRAPRPARARQIPQEIHRPQAAVLPGRLRAPPTPSSG
ncbi:uncharacterized protein [Triticum aestivum]|uniref:uncharacterized protein n=1 Tax=Triticum aestivum TaxID=4565 RepID=UPI001D01C3EE|nr:uncharacterized protein LOC123119311 [Triticum aestivum]